MCCVMPPASPLATLVRRMVSSSDVLPWSTCPMTVTTGARGSSLTSDVRLLLFREEGIRLVELGALGDVPHLLDHDHRGVLVEHLVDGDHGAELHQRLDDLGGLDRHLVRQIGDGDGFRHRDFAHDGLGRRRERVLRVAFIRVCGGRDAPCARASPDRRSRRRAS